MRVIAGVAKGRRLRAVKGYQVRPTLGRVREVLFDILAPRIVGSRFLDLFAGTGSMGIEALSRGAQRSVFVESDRKAVQTIISNLNEIGLANQAKVICQPVNKALPRLAEQGDCFDIIFLDPPYRQTKAVREVLGWLSQDKQILASGGVVVAQESAKADQIELPSGLEAYRMRKIGDSKLTFWRVSKEE